MARSVRSYQREIRQLKELIVGMQWVAPSYNGADSCSCCGNMRHTGCMSDCEAAKVTNNFGDEAAAPEERG